MQLAQLEGLKNGSHLEEMDHEVDPEESVFLRYMRDHVPADFRKAAENQWAICVPQELSLQHVEITREMLRTHILKPSPYFVGFYTTLTGKSLETDEDRIITQQGFRDNGDIQHILREEKFYNKKLKPYRILVIERPLEGTPKGSVVRNDIRIDEKDEILQMDSLISFEKFIIKYGNNLIRDVESELSEFNSSYVLVKGYESHVVERVMHIYTKFIEKFLDENLLLLRKVKMSPKHAEKIRYAAHSYCIHRVYEKIFSHWRNAFEKKDEEFSKVMHKCGRKTSTDFGIPLKLQSPLPREIRLLIGLNQLTSVYEKLRCIKDVARCVSQSVHFSNGQDPLTTDDLIPLIAFALSSIQPPHLVANVEFMIAFQLPEAFATEMTFNLVTMQAAMEFMQKEVENCDDRGDIDDESVDEKYVSAVVPSVDKRRGIMSVLLEDVSSSSPVDNQLLQRGRRSKSLFVESSKRYEGEEEEMEQEKEEENVRVVQQQEAPRVIGIGQTPNKTSELGDFLSSLMKKKL